MTNGKYSGNRTLERGTQESCRHWRHAGAGSSTRPGARQHRWPRQLGLHRAFAPSADGALQDHTATIFVTEEVPGPNSLHLCQFLILCNRNCVVRGASWAQRLFPPQTCMQPRSMPHAAPCKAGAQGHAPPLCGTPGRKQQQVSKHDAARHRRRVHLSGGLRGAAHKRQAQRRRL